MTYLTKQLRLFDLQFFQILYYNTRVIKKAMLQHGLMYLLPVSWLIKI